MSELYLERGFLNMEHVYQRALKERLWLIVILGKRQVGKTYGALHTMLEHDLQHILLRRTTEELETIAASMELSPYKVFEPEYFVTLRKMKRICRICDYFTDEDGNAFIGDTRGLATSLAQISHIRGFNGSSFSDLVYDEFIPEKGVVTRKSEGESFLNAYVTINGNRELEGRPPLRAWLLANTNRIDSPILESLNLTDDILYMRRKGIEELVTSTGAYIIQPDSERITEEREQTALMKQISSKSEFYGMAMRNEFSYDDSPYIKSISVKKLLPAWAYDDFMYCWERPEGFYICRAPFKAPSAGRYTSSRTDRERLALDHAYLKPYYYAGLILFSDLRMLSLFKSIFEID